MKTFLAIIGLLAIGCSAFAQQTIQFEYDAAGNRISRTIAMPAPKVQAPPEEMGKAEAEVPEQELAHQTEAFLTPTLLEDIVAETLIKIYPNPTQGLIKIEVGNPPAGEKVYIRLFDMSGKMILSKESDSYTEIDIIGRPDGVYIMRIAIGEDQSEWKIIKN